MRILPAFISFFFLSFFLFQAVVGQCLSGIYTVGGSSPDYTELSEIVTDLETLGVCGPVIFEFRPGSYTTTSEFQTKLDSIPGNSALNSVTFRSQNGDSSEVVLQRTQFSDWIISMWRTKHIIFEHLSFGVFGTSQVNSGWNVRFNNDNGDIVIRNCVFLDSYQFAIHDVYAQFHLHGEFDNILIENCAFQKANRAVDINPYARRGNVQIINCTFEQERWGMRLSDIDSLYIIGNESSSILFNALTVSSATYANIQENVFRDQVSLNSIGDSTSVEPNILANNFCLGNDSRNVKISGCNLFRIVHNSLYNSLNSSTSGYNLMVINSDNVEVLNNIFAKEGQSASIISFEDLFSKNFSFDYNGYQRPGGFFFMNDTTGYSSLAQFQQATGSGMHSIVDTFHFIWGPSTLHLIFTDSSNLDVFDQGTYLSYVPKDIDGEFRDPNHPDMGADEVSLLIPSFDLTMANVLLPDSACPGAYDLFVDIENLSNASVQDYNIYLSQEGILIDSFLIRLPATFNPDTSLVIPPNAIKDSILLRKVFIGPDTTAHFQMWVNMGNGVVDTLAQNDSISFQLTGFSQPDLQLPDDLNFCSGDSATLSAAPGFSHYQWSTGDSSQQIHVSQSGVYRVEVTDSHGCQNRGIVYAGVSYLNDDVWISRSTENASRVLEGNGNNILVGGQFDLIGPYQPGLGLFDLQSNQHIPIDRSRSTHNTFEEIIPDGQGGWFVITGIQRIDMELYYRLVQYDSLGKLLPLDIEANGLIRDILLHDNRLYVCGAFDTIQGEERIGVAALDPETGLVLDYDPDFYLADIHQLAGYHQSVILVGRVNRKFSSRDYNIVMTDGHSGRSLPDEDWTWIYDELAPLSSSHIYDGTIVEQDGDFLVIKAYWTKVFKLSSQEKIFDVTGFPDAMGIRQNNLYISYPEQLDRLDLSSLQVSIFVDFVDHPDYHVQDFSFTDTSVFAGGYFMIQGDSMEKSVAEFAISTGNPTSFSCYVFNQESDKASVSALDLQSQRILMGGGFESIGGMKRNNLYEFDLDTHRPTDWDPSPDSTVWALEFNDGDLYVGGDFSEINGQSRDRFAAFDSGSQLISHLNYPIDGTVLDFAFTDTSVYIAGEFDSIQQSRNHSLMAVHKQTGNILPFESGVGHDIGLGVVTEVDVIDSVVFFIGNFYHVYDSLGIANERFCDNAIAMVDATSGYVKSCLTHFFLGNSHNINDIQAYDGKLYAGGILKINPPQDPKDMIAINPEDLSIEDVNIQVEGVIRNFEIHCDKIYLSGNFSSVNGEEEQHFAIADFPSGNVYDIFNNPDTASWNPYGNFIFAHQNRLFVRTTYQNDAAYDTRGFGKLLELDLSCYHLPSPDLNLDFNPQINVLQVDFQNLSPGTQNDYHWDFGDGNMSTEDAPSHTYAQAGSYTVHLFASGECGSDTISKQILVGNVGLDERSENNFRLYPNPTSGQLNVSFFQQTFGAVGLKIFDQSGRLILTRKLELPAGEQTIDIHLGDWPSGVYYLMLDQAQNQIGKRFVLLAH
ncbi:MAG: PKD domain-containing protein [Bacteroidota bacterium]